MSTSDGISYFFRGFSLIQTKGIKRFIIVPLVINFILFSAALFYLLEELGIQVAWLESKIPSWLSWIEFIIYPAVLILLLLLFSMVFTTFANWLAAPFNGILAEKLEDHLLGRQSQESSLMGLIKIVPPTLLREWQKLLYFIPRFIVFFLIGWFFPVIGQIIWFLFIAWSLAIQYCDYGFDNNGYKFGYMRHILRQNKGACFSFGSLVSLFTMIPIVNLLVMPVAICGATAMWVDHLKQQAEQDS